MKLRTLLQKNICKATLLSSLCIFGLHFSVLQASAAPLTESSTPFILAVEKDYPPFLFVENGVVQGIAYEFTNLVATKIGKNVEYSEPLQLQEMFNLAKLGKVNLFSDIAKTTEREEFLAFSDPYVSASAVVIERKNDAKKWNESTLNAGVSIAVGRAYGVVSFLKQKFPQAVFVELDSDKDVIRAVALGATDVGVLDAASLTYLIQREPLSNVVVTHQTGFEYQYSFAVLKQDKDILRQINEAIASFTVAEKEAIYSKWVSTFPSKDSYELPSFLKYGFFTIIFVVTGFLLWNILLQKKIKEKTYELKRVHSALDEKIQENTREYALLATEAQQNTEYLEKTKKAILNILEDVKEEKDRFEQVSVKLQLATNAAKISILEMDIQKQLITADENTSALYGIKNDKFLYPLQEWIRFIHPEDMQRVQDKMRVSIESGVSFEDTFRVVWPNKEVHFIKAYAQIEYDKNKKPIKLVGVNFDVTKEKAIDLEKTEFVSLASHQLKTPIGALRWNIEMLLEGDYGNLTKLQKEVISDMYTMNQRMNELVNSLLNVSRIEMGVFIIEPAPTNLQKLCSEVLTELEPRRVKKEHTIEVMFDKHLPNISVDPKLMRIVFQNYLSNAIKYTQNKGKIRVQLGIQNNNVIFAVTNNGEPIPENEKSRIFQKLFRASNANKQDPDGNGLGLYLVKKIMQGAGGEAGFTSSAKQGTTFFVTLPLEGMNKKEGEKNLT